MRKGFVLLYPDALEAHSSRTKKAGKENANWAELRLRALRRFPYAPITFAPDGRGAEENPPANPNAGEVRFIVVSSKEINIANTKERKFAHVDYTNLVLVQQCARLPETVRARVL